VNELKKAIRDKLWGSGSLPDAVDSDVYFGLAPEKGVNLPWITYNFITAEPIRVFAAADDATRTTVQFSIFVSPSDAASDIGVYASDLDLLMDRQTLTYDSKSHVGCIKTLEVGPTRLEDCWQHVMDYEITCE
jgi:hypothetical protein